MDQTDAVVPKAAVIVTSKSTGLSREASTDEAGRYSIVNLLPGVYDLRVTAGGFRPFEQTSVTVSANAVTRVDVRLEVGAVTEQITVAASAAILQTDKSDVRAEITSVAATKFAAGQLPELPEPDQPHSRRHAG